MQKMKIFLTLLFSLMTVCKPAFADGTKWSGSTNHSPNSLSSLSEMEAFEICDGFSDNTGWRGPNHGGPTPAGDYQVDGGVLKIIHHPTPFFYSSTEVEKDYDFDLTKTTWFHFRFRWKENLIGADMYTEFFIDDKLFFGIGINGEQHWLATNFIGGRDFGKCVEKTSDDEFFISAPNTVLLHAADTRLSYPRLLDGTFYRKKYTDWTKFSLKYEAPGESGSPTQGRIRLFVDDYEIFTSEFRGLDETPGTGYIDPMTPYVDTRAHRKLTVKLTTLSDGAEHSYPGNKLGIRGRPCYAGIVPAVPTTLSYPVTPSKLAWMDKFDKVAQVVSTVLRSYYSWLPAYSPTQSQVGAPIPPSHPNYFYTWENDLIATGSTALKNDIFAAIWNGIFAGTVDFETAVYMGVIPLPDPGHIQWKYVPIGTRDRIAKKLAQLKATYSPLMPAAKKWVWDLLYSGGFATQIVHFGYLTPQELRTSPAWKFMSPSEEAEVPFPSTEKSSEMWWDYIQVTRSNKPCS